MSAIEPAKINIEYVGSIEDAFSLVAQSVRELMVMCDKDFIPPLSHREDTSKPVGEQHLSDLKPDIEPYFKIMLAQKNIVAYLEGKIIAFMSFRYNFDKHYFFPSVARESDVINYVTTICVNKEIRRGGIATRFYDFIENIEGTFPSEVLGDCIATRTWHTNESHIGLLKKRGYALTCTLHEERVNTVDEKVGEKVEKKVEKYDTVYYCKRLTGY